MIVMIMMMAPISQPRDHGATVGKTSSKQTPGLGRQEMMEHRPGDFDGLLAFDYFKMMAIIILVPRVKPLRVS